MLFETTVTVLLALAAGGCTDARPDGGLSFPDSAEVEVGQRNSDNKTPLYAPNRCAENELLYPADYHNDWVCDCKPGYLYYPPTSRCYEPLRQGPCPAPFILHLPAGTFVPQCKRNPCPQGDGFVRFRGNCHQLGTAGPCRLAELGIRLALNETTLQPDCIQLNQELQTRFDGDDDNGDEATTTTTTTTTTQSPVEAAAQLSCPVGSRRWLERICRK